MDVNEEVIKALRAEQGLTTAIIAERVYGKATGAPSDLQHRHAVSKALTDLMLEGKVIRRKPGDLFRYYMPRSRDPNAVRDGDREKCCLHCGQSIHGNCEKQCDGPGEECQRCTVSCVAEIPKYESGRVAT
jgi:hypothetical protein